MGWFLVFPCFNTSKHRKLKKSVNLTTSSFSVDEGNEKTCEYVLIKVPTEESTKWLAPKHPFGIQLFFYISTKYNIISLLIIKRRLLSCIDNIKKEERVFDC
ncbi:hypothetical protein L2E82_32287 [Cichorium intybus]|uniref:Uncharacterized protein n=1 Tax=Cichorium intybus TaxID=13427 RepID=A0ACB9BGD3_CICIN|nr:hypothetical protein L2E82_32287 [Cichorium intybus]